MVGKNTNTPTQTHQEKYYVMMRFAIVAMTNDFVAPPFGTHRLKDYYIELKKRLEKKTDSSN